MPVVRNYANPAAASQEVKLARIYGGIHYRFSCDVGQVVGEQVADYILQHCLRPIEAEETEAE